MTLKYNELQDLVLPKLSIDEFSPKTGDNNDVIVLGFYVKDKEPAKDLSHFIENGAYEILDVENSPASNDEGEYMVFVEVDRNDKFFDLTEKIVEDLGNIMEISNWKYKPTTQKRSLTDQVKVGRTLLLQIQKSMFPKKNLQRTL